MNIGRILLIFFLMGSTPKLLSYKITFTSSEKNCPQRIDVYITKNKNSMDDFLKSSSFKGGVYKGLALTNKYFRAVIPYIKAGTKFFPEIGKVADDLVGRTADIHEFIVVTIPGLSSGLIDSGIRKAYDIIMFHKDISLGESANWDEKDIAKKYKDKTAGSDIYMTIMSGDTVLLYNYKIATNSTISIQMKQDPVSKDCIALPITARGPIPSKNPVPGKPWVTIAGKLMQPIIVPAAKKKSY